MNYYAMMDVCKLRKECELSCRGCYYESSCKIFTDKFQTTPNNLMEVLKMIKTGKSGIKELIEGRTKIDKSKVIGDRLPVSGICTGVSKDNGAFVYLLIGSDEYVAVPAANLEECIEYANNPEDKAAFESGAYVVIFESHTSDKNREYFTCYFEEANAYQE